MFRGQVIGAALAVLLTASACASQEQQTRFQSVVGAELHLLDRPGLVIGEFQLAPHGILDGDTVRIKGGDSSLRLLGIDTEETFKKAGEREAAARDFKLYLKNNRGDSKRPRKAATPLGEAAKEFAKKFFADADVVRLERDHPKEIRGRYGRYLTYIFAKKNGEWVNYNVECVRAGMSPYFMKYSYSRRFHDQFVAAEKEAKAAKRGIWNPKAEAYTDYDERSRWWNARARFIRDFEKEADTRGDMIILTHWDALLRIKEREGRRVKVLGTVSDIKRLGKNVVRVRLGRRQFEDFPIIFKDRTLFEATKLRDYVGEFVVIEGPVSSYGKRAELQIIVDNPKQVQYQYPDVEEGGK